MPLSSAERDRLREIKTFPSLVKYLRDDLDWPIESDSFDEISFDYTAEELGIDEKTAAKIQEIKQLRPLVTGQPWGIFFIKFEPRRLPVLALRRILGRLVVKKRASANKSDRAAWEKQDLLFISNYGEGDSRQITFAHFTDNGHHGDLPTLKVLGWDGEDTALHLDHVQTELRDHLRWPDDQSNLPAWRNRWSGAFELKHREVITTSKQLAIQLADLAKVIRKKCNAAMKIETEKGPLRTLMKAFQQALIHDLTADDFGDMYAQTIAYGLLSARVSRPAGLTADNLADMVPPQTNPFLKELLETFLNIGGRKYDARKGHLTGIDFDELGINDVVDTLRAANMEAVLIDFGNRNPQEDPVVHFYELFLKEYDAKKRMQRGVFYTPKPVVSYIVRSVHELLQTEFGLPDGLADITTWAEMLKKHKDLKLPTFKVKKPNSPDLIDQPIDPNSPFVQILDPATGTATFLVETIDIIHKTMVAKWKKDGHGDLWINQKWNDYVPKHLLPRLHGYELMMAPYAIAHMKIGLKLFETGYTFGSGERARIYLTNALEPAQDFSDTFEQMAPALAHEAKAVNYVKRHQRFTVVIGNPPYSGESANKLPWVERDVKETYQQINGIPLKEKGKKNWLLDDYVKFLRLSHRTVAATGVGLIGHIVNNAFQDNPTFRGLRRSLLMDFQSVRILDLHGSGTRSDSGDKSSSDENVFDILQGVCILILSRTIKAKGTSSVTRGDFWGRRENKYQKLASTGLTAAAQVVLHPKEDQWYFITLDLTNEAEWGAFVSLLDAMPINGNGLISAKDHFAYAITSREFRDDLKTFTDESLSDSDVARQLKIRDNSMWSLHDGRLRLRKELSAARFCEVAYRPFDTRHSLFHRDVIFNLRLPVTKHIIEGKNVVLLTTRMTKGSEWKHCFVSRLVSDCAILSNQTSTNAFAFPLMRKREEGVFKGGYYEPNFSPSFLSKFAGDPTISAEVIFQYVYTIFHSPQYRTRFAQFLQLEIPRFPVPVNLDLIHDLAKVGGDLISLHLLESAELNKYVTRYAGAVTPAIAKVTYANGTVWLDEEQTCGFVGVPEAVWNFHIGGYQVCHKWLKDRKGRTLSQDDIAHYQKIVVALNETIRLMKEIDETIEKHGGWPGAFVTAAASSK